MKEYVLSAEKHNEIVQAAYEKRGYNAEEAGDAAKLCQMASTHGIKTHNAIKALHLDDLFGSGNAKHQGCIPDATIEKRPSRFAAVERWNGHGKLGQSVAFEAIETCIKLADQYGVGTVSVDNAFHYLWGGGYVMDAAKRGYIAYTNCTSALTEVVPFGGKFPTLGTNPHSWGFPTTDAVGFPIVIDWATSVVAMGRVQQFQRENKPLPPNAAVDKDGNPTTDPHAAVSLLPFGAHKGYGLALINEIVGAMIGGSLPTIRSRPEIAPANEKLDMTFYFQVIHPEAISGGAFSSGRDQAGNVKAVLDDILGHGNESCMLPGQIEHEAGVRTQQAGGLLFTQSEIDGFSEVADECGVAFDIGALKTVDSR